MGRGRSVAEGVATFVVLQAAWLACVVGAARDRRWLGLVLVVLLVAAAAWRSTEPRRELETVVALGVAGSLVDSVEAYFGLLQFRGEPWLGLAPPWITALWLHFGLLVRGPFRALRGRPWVAATVGAVGGPLAYWAGVRLGAATFHPETWRSLTAIAAVWSVVLPASLWLAWRAARTREETA